jgi:hypothetical protein
LQSISMLSKELEIFARCEDPRGGKWSVDVGSAR